MSDDYFANHARATRFPWTIYHAPLERDLLAFLGDVSRAVPAPEVLVIGCGLLGELGRLPPRVRLSCTDVDERAVAAVAALGDPRVVRAFVSDPDAVRLPPEPQFHAIYMKEVIEHLADPPAYLRGVARLLLPGGKLWVSTPNYGEPWLPLVERTVLELVARRSGFSRRHIHPSPFSRRTLERALRDAGLSDVATRVVASRFALVGTGAR